MIYSIENKKTEKFYIKYQKEIDSYQGYFSYEKKNSSHQKDIKIKSLSVNGRTEYSFMNDILTYAAYELNKMNIKNSDKLIDELWLKYFSTLQPTLY